MHLFNKYLFRRQRWRRDGNSPWYSLECRETANLWVREVLCLSENERRQHAYIHFLLLPLPITTQVGAQCTISLLAYIFEGQKSKISFSGLRSRCQLSWFPSRLSRGELISLPLPALEASCHPWLVAPSSTLKASIIASSPLTEICFCSYISLQLWSLCLPLLEVYVIILGPMG